MVGKDGVCIVDDELTFTADSFALTFDFAINSASQSFCLNLQPLLAMINSVCRAPRGQMLGRASARRFSLYVALCLGSLSPAYATTYYIDPAGSNSNNGTSTGTPWQDFTNVNARNASNPFLAGDQILLKRGGSWNQEFDLFGSGTATNFIQVGAYGTGNRPRIQRTGNVADRCLMTHDTSYVKISSLEVSEAGAGIVIHYDHSYNHNSVYVDDCVAHGFYEIKTNYYSGTLGYLKGTNGWENKGPGKPPTPTYVAPDDVAFSYGIGVTGSCDTPNNNTTVLTDFRVTNCEVYHAGVGVALDWNNHTNPDGTWPSDNKFHDALFDNLYVHDIDVPWVSVTGVFFGTGCTNGVFKNSYLYRAGYYASGGTAAISFYRQRNTLIENVTVVSEPEGAPTDMAGMDYIEDIDCTIKNCTFYNCAGYGIGNTGGGPWNYYQATGINWYNNTFINMNWFWPVPLTGPNSTLHWFTTATPTGTIHDNAFIFAPDNVLNSGNGDWSNITFYANDEIQNITSGLDLANGKTATASSVYGAGYEASKAVDGNDGTRWASIYSGGTEWLQVDLGAVYAFNQVTIAWQDPSYAVKYMISLSADGSTWTEVHNRNLTNHGSLGTSNDVFPTAKARYVKVTMTLPNTSPPNYSLYRLSVYNNENLAQGKTSTASSSSTSARYTPDFGNDGNDSSRWASATQSGAQWYKVDLGAAYLINEVRTNWDTAYAKDYTIATSTDDFTYNTAVTRTNVASAGITRDVLPRVSARYVKLTMTRGYTADPTYYAIADMRVFAARNIAQDQVATASSTTPTLGYDLPRAIDGNDNTRWSSAVQSGAQWFKVDFGTSYQINEAIIKWDTAFAKAYTIGVSTNDSTYTTVANISGIASAGTTTDKFASTSARYLKVTMTQGYVSDPTNYSIKTLLANNDMARGVACTASSTNATYPTANAVDTSDTTRWSSLVQSGAQWFKVDLGSAHTVDRILINWNTAYAKDYTIATSTDNITYTTVATRAGLLAATVTDDKLAQATSARYIKITMTAGYVPDPVNYSIHTVNVYGPHP